MNQVAANAQWGNPHLATNGYGPFLPRPSSVFTDGAFGPMSPIQPVPVDVPPPGGQFPDPRWWQAPVGFNLPSPPGTEGFKLASFSQLQTIAEKYSVARRCIQLRKEEICGLEWSIEMTTQAAMAYQGDHKAMRDFGERAAKAKKFFQPPRPGLLELQFLAERNARGDPRLRRAGSRLQAQVRQGAGPGAAGQRPGQHPAGFRSDHPPDSGHARRDTPPSRAGLQPVPFRGSAKRLPDGDHGHRHRRLRAGRRRD